MVGAAPNGVEGEKASEADGKTVAEKPAEAPVEVPVAVAQEAVPAKETAQTVAQEVEPVKETVAAVANIVEPVAPQPVGEVEPNIQKAGYSTLTPPEPPAQDAGYSGPSSDESPTGVFTPAEDAASDEQSTGTFEEQDSEGVTKDFFDATITETAESEAPTGYLSGGLSGSAVDISGAGLYVELMSTGSYDPATDSVIAGNDSRDDAENVTGFLS